VPAHAGARPPPRAAECSATPRRHQRSAAARRLARGGCCSSRGRSRSLTRCAAHLPSARRAVVSRPLTRACAACAIAPAANPRRRHRMRRCQRTRLRHRHHRTRAPPLPQRLRAPRPCCRCPSLGCVRAARCGARQRPRRHTRARYDKRPQLDSHAHLVARAQGWDGQQLGRNAYSESYSQAQHVARALHTHTHTHTHACAHHAPAHTANP
jgi:hypothetical protein